MAAVLACGDGAVLSHRTAAALHELRSTARVKIGVTVPRRSARRHTGVQIHRSITLTDADITTVNGIPCTTVARVFLELGSVPPRRPVERAFDQAEVEGVLNLTAVVDQLERNPNHPGAPTVKAILAQHYIGSTLTQSELEEAFLALCRRARVPQPEVNKWVDLGDAEPPIKADFLLAQGTRDRRDRRPPVPRHPPGLRARPATRSARDARRLAAGSDDLAPGHLPAAGARGDAAAPAPRNGSDAAHALADAPSAYARAGVPTEMIRQGWSLSSESPIVHCSVKRDWLEGFPDTTAVVSRSSM